MSRGIIIEPDENGLYGGVVIYGPDGITPISSTNPLNVSLTGSNMTENPLGTAVGQTVVSSSENFWAHMERIGRPRNRWALGTAVNTTGSTSILQDYPDLNTRLYPKFMTVSANVNGWASIVVQMNIPQLAFDGSTNNSSAFFEQYLAVGQPWTLYFDGETYADEGGYVQVQFQADTASGKAWASYYGIEVTQQ